MRTVRLLSPMLPVVAALLATVTAVAEEFPARVVRLIVPYPAGGGVDGLARPIAERLSRAWRQPVVIENKTGASTMIGGEFVARSPADGYTLFFTSDSSITSNPHLFRKAPFDPVKELAPVTQIIDLHQMVVVHPSVKASTMQELVDLARREPSALNYGSYGSGSQPNLLFETLKAQTGVQILHVPFRGIAPALTATIGNTVQMTLGGAATTRGHIEAGQLKPLAIGRKERLKSHPAVPTLREAGFPEVEPRSWFGLLAPAGTPRAVVARINQAMNAALASPTLRQRLAAQGADVVGGTPESFGNVIRADFAKWGKVVRASGARVD